MWWEEAKEALPQRVVQETSRAVDDGEWPGVAAAALAWWDASAPRRARRSPIVKPRAREAAPPQWPEVAAAAGVWWEETFESGVYAKRGTKKTLVA
jgi:hypothetical protein